MEEEDAIIAVLGLLLTQVRTARRALEEVERNTSRYLGFEFARAFSEGPSFGRPPMFQGALKVHVININDLAPGNTFGDFLRGVLGGIGNFVGGVVSGVISGTLSVFALPQMISKMERITANVRSIIRELRVNRPNTEEREGRGSNTQAQAQSGESLITTLEGIGRLVRNLTALFQAGSSGPGDASGPNQAGRTTPEVLTRSGERWLSILNSVNRVLDRTDHIVRGLIVLIHLVVGSIALLIANLANIRRAILETIQFALRNVLLLRGVILTTIFETVSTAARLAASVVAILGTTIQSVLTSITGVVGMILDSTFAALETLTSALQAVIRSLLQWLVTGVFNTLRAIGNLTVFRTVDHFVRILPGILDPIFRIVVAYKAGASQSLPEDVTDRLNRAFDAGFEPAPGTGSSGSTPGGAITGSGPSATSEQIIGEFPRLNDILDPLRATLTSAVDATGAHMVLATRDTFGDVGETLGNLAGRFDGPIEREADHSRNVLGQHLRPLQQRADELAQAITAPIEAQSQPTGLEEIAEAYQEWLTRGDGLNQILSLATTYFENTPESAPQLGMRRGEQDRPRASVEIDRVEIIIEEPAEGAAAAAPVDETLGSLTPEFSDEDIWLAWHRHNISLEERVVQPADLRVLIA